MKRRKGHVSKHRLQITKTIFGMKFYTLKNNQKAQCGGAHLQPQHFGGETGSLDIWGSQSHIPGHKKHGAGEVA